MVRLSCFGSNSVASVRQASCLSFRQGIPDLECGTCWTDKPSQTWDELFIFRRAIPNLECGICRIDEPSIFQASRLYCQHLAHNIFKAFQTWNTASVFRISHPRLAMSCLSFRQAISDLGCGICLSGKVSRTWNTASAGQITCQIFCYSKHSKESVLFRQQTSHRRGAEHLSPSYAGSLINRK